MTTQTYPQFIHHGAADGVTGSCHRYIASEQLHLLIDCGLFQGVEANADGRIDHKIEFDLACVRALIVTHVHIDHIGRLPYLLAAGFKGPIFCSIPSARLLPLVIEDALKLGFTRDTRVVEYFLATVREQLMPLNYHEWYVMVNQDLLQLRVRLQMAGHILGSAYVELELKTRTTTNDSWHSHVTVFSGDLGAPYAPLLPAPKAPYRADTLIIESTYGNRVHESRRERREKLKALVETAMKDGGTVLIPAFSIGRTQELLYEFESILHETTAVVGASLARDSAPLNSNKTQLAGGARSHNGAEVERSNRSWSDIAIIVDSPLAAKFTEVYAELEPYWDKEALQRLKAGRHPLDFESLITVDSHEDHERLVRHLAETKRPAIVLAASGMAAGGRIVNYLKAMIDDPVHAVLFVGYQAPGTPGHAILKCASPVGASLARDSASLNSNRAQIAGEARSHKGTEVGASPARDSAPLNSIRAQIAGEARSHRVQLDGEFYQVRAMVTSIGGYSAHADQRNLLSFVRNMKRWPQQIRIVHGNDQARAALREKFLEMAKARGTAIEVVLPNRTVGASLARDSASLNSNRAQIAGEARSHKGTEVGASTARD